MSRAHQRDVELVSTGSELLDGRRLNTHGQLLGGELSKLGLRLMRDTTVPDGPDAMRDAISSAMQRVDIVFITGGLGPTSDDVTRDVVAELTGKSVVMHEPTRIYINEWLVKRGRKSYPAFDRHALVVEGATVLSNRAGLSAGELVEFDGKALILLPGPPHELRAIMEDHVMPWLRVRMGAELPLCRSFRFAGIGESEIARRLEVTGFTEEGMEIAYCARPGDVELRFTVHPSLRMKFDDSVALVRRIFGNEVYSETDGEEISLERIVGGMLRDRKLTLATAESCTGGLISHRITNVPGSSDYFRGGFAAYANDVKQTVLAVRAETLAAHGAVSEATAREMAEGVRRALGADIGVSTTGIAGPTGGTPEKPVGLVYIGVADADGVVVLERRTGGAREFIKMISAQAALDHLRCRLLGVS